MYETRMSPDGRHVAVKNRPDEINKWSVTNGGYYHDTHVADWTPLYGEPEGQLLEWTPGLHGTEAGRRGGVVLFAIGMNIHGPGFVLSCSLPSYTGSTVSEDRDHLHGVAEVAYRRWLAQTGALAV